MSREYTLPEAAENVGATVDQLRYWISLMEIESTRRGKCRYLAEEDVSRLRGMAAMVKGGTSPKEAAALAREKPVEAVIIPEAAAQPPAVIDELQRALLLVADENRVIKQTMGVILEEVRAVRTENAALRDQMALLAAPRQDDNLFEILKKPVPPAKAWQPPVARDPLEGAGLLTRAWIYLLRPEKMRRHMEN